MKALYKYPQQKYPYAELVHENMNRSNEQPEYELEDTGIFNGGFYWDVMAEYAKNTPEDILIRISLTNRSSKTAVIDVIPTLWYRNTWIWGCTHEGCTVKPKLKKKTDFVVHGNHETLGEYVWEVDEESDGVKPMLIFTENETNTVRLFDIETYTRYVKDAFHRYVIDGEKDAVNPKHVGTKVGTHYKMEVAAGKTVVIKSRLRAWNENSDVKFNSNFNTIFEQRIKEADSFYNNILGGSLSNEQRIVARQAFAGLLWSKQFYHYIVKDWLNGDPDQPPPPESRKYGRNSEWKHLFNRDVISMPDKWEYPWYASWDHAFHMLPFSIIDIEFAKQQLLLFLREWYMHPNGQIPAYEFAFDDVNPPVHAFAVNLVYKATGPRGQRDHQFLARCFQKLILNFTWWINRKDPRGKNIFAGGFLGLDNIGVFDRSKPLPIDGEMEQADGTAWVAFFCILMLNNALDLAKTDPTYEDMASKFFEHFILIVDAMNKVGDGEGLWDDEDGFYYDHIRMSDGTSIPLKIRSLVGLVPLFACMVLEDVDTEKLEGFKKRTDWFLQNRKDLTCTISYMVTAGNTNRHLLAIPTKDQLIKLLSYMLDEEEFLSPYGIRSLSKYHKDHPFVLSVNGSNYEVSYVPGESNTYLFGGNSNWRGPIWLCMNYLIIMVLRRYHYFYGDSLKVECPTRSGNMMNLAEVSQELSSRMVKLFLPDENGYRPCHGNSKLYAEDTAWKDLVLFYEYFHGDSGRGCGASHQTGWTALVVNCMNLKQ
ncbi:Uncharacterised protein g9697 [Pycnogonum litorale]